MSIKKKNYLKGSAREVKFSNGGSIINVDFLLSELQALPVNEAGYVKIVIAENSKGPDRFGNTHSVYENDFVPSKEASEAKKAQLAAQKNDFKSPGRPAQFKGRTNSDDLPF